MQVRLLVNVINAGVFYPADSVVDTFSDSAVEWLLSGGSCVVVEAPEKVVAASKKAVTDGKKEDTKRR